MDLLSRASGRFPSNRGVIGAGWEKTAGGVRAWAELPPGIQGELRLPSGAHPLPAGRRTEIIAAG
jgi:hypothetical protein